MNDYERLLDQLRTQQQAVDQAAADVMGQATQPGGPAPELVKRAEDAQQALEMANKLIDPDVPQDHKNRMAPGVTAWAMGAGNPVQSFLDEHMPINPQMEGSFAEQAGRLTGSLLPFVLVIATIVAWLRGWKAKALLPLLAMCAGVAGLLVGFVAGLEVVFVPVFGAVFLIAPLVLIGMACRPPKKKAASETKDVQA